MGSSRNVVLVSVDSLRADHCGFLGDDRGLTPFLDRLASDGIVFTDAVSPGPRTFTSMPAIVTGVHRDPSVVRSKSHRWFWQRRLDAIADHLRWFEPIQKRLRERGYSTAGISPNPWTSEAAGFDRGFDHFLDLSGSNRSVLHRVVDRLPFANSTSKPVEYTLDHLTNSSFFSRWETYYQELVNLRERLEEPYFLWVFLLDTHFPYFAARSHRRESGLATRFYASVRGRRAFKTGEGAPPAHVGRLLRRSYRDAVRAVDAFVEEFWSDVREDDPVLVFHSDHGETLGERGRFGHHTHLFEENVHVPYVVHDGETAGTITDPTSLATIHDTVANVARHGRFTPASAPEYPFVRSELGESRALRGRRIKFVDSEEAGHLLFDLAEDAGERTNVASEYPDLVDALSRHLDRRERRELEKSRIAETVDDIVEDTRV